MSVVDAVRTISKSLEFCHSHYCSNCPKSDACSLIFDDSFIESEIYDLAVRCSKFNAVSNDQDN